MPSDHVQVWGDHGVVFSFNHDNEGKTAGDLTFQDCCNLRSLA